MIRLSADTLDILELSDAFRRGVGAMPGEMVENARKVMGYASQLYPEYPHLPDNDVTCRRIERLLADMAEQQIEPTWPVTTVILPIDGRSPIGRMVAEKVNLRYGNVHFKLQSARYDDTPEMAAHPVKAALDAITPFAQGYRGLANIGYATKLG